MRTFVVSAPGKLHLIGEHVVVYGKPAIIAATNKRCNVKISERNDNDIVIISEELESKMYISEDIIFERTKNARHMWNLFQDNHNISVLNELIKDPLNLIVFAIGETLLYYQKRIDKGFTIDISCEIPIGAGMGSSAALATATVGAVALFLGEKLDKEIINEISFLVEQRVHGDPSGGDNAASCYGGFLWFRKETPDLKIIKQLPFYLSQELQQQFYIFYTGRPQETTGEMVNIVRILYGKKPKFVEAILQDQEELARRMVDVLRDNDESELMQIIKRTERNLQSLEVVSSDTQQLIRKIEVFGGAAKICGAGGAKFASGAVLSIHKDQEILREIGQKTNITFESIVLGTEGIKQE